MQPIRKILDFFILKCYDNKNKDILYAWKRTFCFHKCYDREQTSWAESVCGKAKQNYHLGAAAERLIQTKGSVINLQEGQSVTLLNLGGTTRIVTRPLLRDEIFIFTDKGVCSYEHQSEFKRRQQRI